LPGDIEQTAKAEAKKAFCCPADAEAATTQLRACSSPCHQPKVCVEERTDKLRCFRAKRQLQRLANTNASGSRLQCCAVFRNLRGGAARAAAADRTFDEVRPPKTEQVEDDEQPIGQGICLPVDVEPLLDLVDIGRDGGGIAACAVTCYSPLNQV
jgi:hypothetical protein